MKHLDIEEMMEYVSMTELNEETVALAARVTEHIRGCDDCLQAVRAFQTLYDQFLLSGTSMAFSSFAEEQHKKDGLR